MPLEIDAYPDLKLALHGGLDIVSPIHVKGTEYNYPAAVIDLKLATSRFNEHGKYCWGVPQYMDMMQIVLYSTITNLPGFYYIFDYKEKTGNGHLLLPVATMAMFPNGPQTQEDEKYYTLAKQRLSDIKVSVKKTVEQVMKMDSEGYVETPSYENCDRCPLSKMYPNGTCDKMNFIKRM
jgi:hypothetical protein